MGFIDMAQEQNDRFIETKVSCERTLRELGFVFTESQWQRDGINGREWAELRQVRDGWVFDTFSGSDDS